MVEGPGATRNANKLQAVVGCQVVAETPAELSVQYVGLRLVEAFSIGKEVFMVFSDDTAIRLHFGMNGSLILLRNGQSVVKRLYGKPKQASFRMTFCPDQKEYDNMAVQCFDTSVTHTISAKVARSKRDRLQCLDVCNQESNFDPNSVQDAIEKRPTAMICDAILDQNKFPGVGNIIKIEGLHQARIHPKRLVNSLSKEELCRVVLECRKYAMSWLKSGRAPCKKVYNETTCKTCKTFGSVRMVKLGSDLSRVTFWCEMCQAIDPKSAKAVATTQMLLSGSNIPYINRQQNIYSLKHSCPQHGSHSFCIRRVHHQEQNRNRLFGSCQRTGCPHFVWVDTHFPNCSNCKKKLILRVSKKERSSGRWFLSCPTMTCKRSFIWATNKELEPLGKFLTPLL